MDRQKFAFDKTNFILLAIGMAVIIVGFLLMTGPSSTEGYFEPDIFSVRRIKVAPAVCFFGFIFMIYGIVRKPKDLVRQKDILSRIFLVYVASKWRPQYVSLALYL